MVNDGLTAEEIVRVRDRCRRMIATAATAGAAGSWVDARKALLATVFETHPDLDQEDLDKYLAVRGLVSATAETQVLGRSNKRVLRNEQKGGG